MSPQTLSSVVGNRPNAIALLIVELITPILEDSGIIFAGTTT